RARSGRELVVVVEQQDGDAALGEVDREAQTDRAGTDDDHGVEGGRRGLLVEGRSIVEFEGLVVRHVDDPMCRAWIPAFAGMTFTGNVIPAFAGMTFTCTVIPAKAGIHACLTTPIAPTSPSRAPPSRRAGRGIRSPRRAHVSRRKACSGRRSPTGRTWASAPHACPGRSRAGPCRRRRRPARSH